MSGSPRRTRSSSASIRATASTRTVSVRGRSAASPASQVQADGDSNQEPAVEPQTSEKVKQVEGRKLTKKEQAALKKEQAELKKKQTASKKEQAALEKQKKVADLQEQRRRHLEADERIAFVMAEARKRREEMIAARQAAGKSVDRLNLPSRSYACMDFTDPVQFEDWRKKTLDEATYYASSETETELRASSEAPTELRGRTRSLSELSEPPDVPPSKKTRLTSSTAAAERGTIASTSITVPPPNFSDIAATHHTDEVPAPAATQAGLGVGEIESAMQVDILEALAAWGGGGATATSASLGLATPPSGTPIAAPAHSSSSSPLDDPFVSAPSAALMSETAAASNAQTKPRPKPKPKPRATAKMTAAVVQASPTKAPSEVTADVPASPQKVTKRNAVENVRPAEIVDEIEDDVERDAAHRSPIKQRGVRLTSQSFVSITDASLATPKPAKFRYKVVPPQTPDFIEQSDNEATPIKGGKGKGKGRGKGKGKGLGLEKGRGKGGGNGSSGSKRIDADTDSEEAVVQEPPPTKAKARTSKTAVQTGTSKDARRDGEASKKAALDTCTSDVDAGEDEDIEQELEEDSEDERTSNRTAKSKPKFLDVAARKRGRASSIASSRTATPSGEDSGDDQQTARRNRSTTPSKKYRIGDLPGGPAAQERWVNHFCPTLVCYEGTREDPWAWEDHWSVPVIQLIWDATLGDVVHHRVTSGDVVHFLATSRLYEWRKVIGHAAGRVVENFFTSSDKYKTSEENRASGLFKSRFVLPVIAIHLDQVVGAITVPGLYKKAGEQDWPCGAIGLATAAVERIFDMWNKGQIKIGDKGLPCRIPQRNPATGRVSLYLTDFREENYSTQTGEYVSSAKAIVPERRAGLLDAVRAHTAQRGPDRGPATGQSSRATLVDIPE